MGEKSNGALRKRGGAQLHYWHTHTHAHTSNWWRGVFFFLLLLSSLSANESSLPGNPAVEAHLLRCWISVSELKQGNSCLGRYQPGVTAFLLMTVDSWWWAKVQIIDLIDWLIDFLVFFKFIYILVKWNWACFFLCPGSSTSSFKVSSIPSSTQAASSVIEAVPGCYNCTNLITHILAERGEVKKKKRKKMLRDYMSQWQL